jgi:opacity protein-like surface antigen
MKRSLSKLVLVSIPTLIVSFASAQTLPNPVYVRLTLGTPAQQDVRDDLSSLGYGASVGYSFNTHVTNLDTALQLGYLGANGHGNRFNAIDILAVGRYSFGNTRVLPYVGVGAGVSFTEVQKHGASAPPVIEDSVLVGRASGLNSGNGGTHNQTDFVVDLLAGVNLNPTNFIEIGYRIAPKISGVRTDFLTLSYGIRF